MTLLTLTLHHQEWHFHSGQNVHDMSIRVDEGGLLPARLLLPW
jgi:hypothetical protein